MEWLAIFPGMFLIGLLMLISISIRNSKRYAKNQEAITAIQDLIPTCTTSSECFDLLAIMMDFRNNNRTHLMETQDRELEKSIVYLRGIKKGLEIK